MKKTPDKTVEEIKELLKQYRPNRTELNERMKQIECLEAMVEYNGIKPNMSEREAIEGMCLGASRLSHIPRSITNKFTSKTENAVFHYENDMSANRFEQNKLLEGISKIRFEIERLEDEITLIENLLNSLRDKDKFIVETKYIQGYSTNESLLFYNEKYSPYTLGERQFLTRKAKALQNMADIKKSLGVNV